MEGETKRSVRSQLYFIISISIATIYLFIPNIHFDEIDLWARLTPTTLVLIGYIGSICNKKYVRYFGWMGVFLFFFVSNLAQFPSEDYILGFSGKDKGFSKVVSNYEIIFRIITGIAITYILIFSYRRIVVSPDV